MKHRTHIDPAIRKTEEGAFTRTELIVLIVVFAFIALWMVPATAASRMKSGLTVCLDNQRQLTAAWRLHANDNSDQVVGSSDSSNLDWRVSPGKAYFDSNPPPPSPIVHNAQEAVTKFDSWGYQLGAIYPYAPDPMLLRCPNDIRRERNLAAHNAYAVVAEVGIGNSSIRLNKASEILHPADRFLWVEETDNRTVTLGSFTFVENLGTWLLRSPPPDPSQGSTYGVTRWSDAPSASHQGGSTLGYADGHAYFRRWIDPDTVRSANNPVWGRSPFVTPTVTNDLWFMVRGYPSRLNP